MKGNITNTANKTNIWNSLSFLAFYLGFLCSMLLKIKKNNLTNATKTTKLNFMTNQTKPKNDKSAQLASLITEIVVNKGTCFAGFTYNGKRRNLTLGAKLASRLAGGKSWGSTYANGAIIEHNQNLYVQGIPNNEESNAPVKRFKLSEVTDFVIG